MIETVWLDTSEWTKEELEKAMPFLTSKRKERLDKLKNSSAFRLSAGAGLLLYAALEKNGLQNKLDKIQYGAHGKPFLPDSGFFFNLSHSGSIALCAFGDVDLGADIQQIRERIPQKTAKILSSQEKEYLLSKEGRGQAEAFYQIWARKESLMKWDGRGLRLPMQTLNVVQNGELVNELIFEGKTVLFHEYSFYGYAVNVCWEKEPFSAQKNTNCDKSIKKILKTEFFR